MRCQGSLVEQKKMEGVCSRLGVNGADCDLGWVGIT